MIPDGCPLNEKQFVTMTALCEGRSPQELASEAGVSHSAFRSRLGTIYRRLGAKDVMGAMAVMFRRQWYGSWTEEAPVDVETPLAREHPFLAAYLKVFEDSRWPHEVSETHGKAMALALAGHELSQQAKAA